MHSGVFCGKGYGGVLVRGWAGVGWGGVGFLPSQLNIGCYPNPFMPGNNTVAGFRLLSSEDLGPHNTTKTKCLRCLISWTLALC